MNIALLAINNLQIKWTTTSSHAREGKTSAFRQWRRPSQHQPTMTTFARRADFFGIRPYLLQIPN